MTELGDHDWADGVTTVSLVRGLTPAQLVVALNAQGPRGELVNDEVIQLDLDLPQVDGRWVHAVQVLERDGWAVLLEPNSQDGVDPRLTQALSERGELVSVYRSINADMEFRYAVGGVLRRSFDPLVLHPAVGEPLPQEVGLVFGDPDADAFEQAVLLAERVTGVGLSTEWILDLPHAVYLVPNAVD